ncbi:MAG: helix-turn-helix transcriptional regulator [Clostridia bacterium]|nr:helix-turn-helix transcriptional regulator [Clostridia bacterium]
MNIIKRIDDLRKERNWSVNFLAMEAGLTPSTLSSMLMRNTPPKLDTLQSLCDAFGITLAQFFLEDESVEIVSEQEKKLLAEFRKLPAQKQSALLSLIKE